MDYSEKMKELEALWQDSFDLCKAMVESCKSGDTKLTGSILKELNAFIKQSIDFLHHKETEQALRDQQEQRMGDLPDFDDLNDDSIDPGDLPEFPEDDDAGADAPIAKETLGEELNLPAEYPVAAAN
jgi:hypothetical protein